jgi:hypothetical protein
MVLEAFAIVFHLPEGYQKDEDETSAVALAELLVVQLNCAKVELRKCFLFGRDGDLAIGGGVLETREEKIITDGPARPRREPSLRTSRPNTRREFANSRATGEIQ